jgi:hypothetical protein
MTVRRHLLMAVCALLAGCGVMLAGIWCLAHAFRTAGAGALTVPMLVVGPPAGIVIAKKLLRQPDYPVLTPTVGSWVGMGVGYALAIGVLWISDHALFLPQSTVAVVVVILACTGWFVGIIGAVGLRARSSNRGARAA